MRNSLEKSYHALKDRLQSNDARYRQYSLLPSKQVSGNELSRCMNKIHLSYQELLIVTSPEEEKELCLALLRQINDANNLLDTIEWEKKI